MTAVLPRLQARSARNPDLGLLAPHLPAPARPNTAYHAFVVPTFETGRLGGLGLDPAGAPLRHHVRLGPLRRPGRRREPSRSTTAGTSAPAPRGDFEYLVRLLKPQPVDQRVGTRDMDVQDPGLELPGHRRRRLGGILGSAARCGCRELTSTRTS